jgi:phosphatidylinositol-3-phosphatase
VGSRTTYVAVAVVVLLAAGFAAAAALGRSPAPGKGCHGQGSHGCTTTTTTTPSTTTTGSSPCGTSVGSEPTTYQHVVWIVFENKSYSEIVGSGAAPYLNSLAAQCGLATNYSAVAHPSLPNYIALTSGSTQGITDDNAPSLHPLGVASIFSQLGSGWNAKNESMQTNCQLSDSPLYAVRHNPATYYTGIRTACALQDTPGGIGANAPFTFVTPNLCDDMHDCSVATGDQWLAANLPGLLSSSAYTGGGTAVFVTWDEDDGSASNHVATLVISPYTPAGARSSAAFDHYGLLATTQSMLGLGCLGSSCSASSLRSAFGL